MEKKEKEMLSKTEHVPAESMSMVSQNPANPDFETKVPSRKCTEVLLVE